VLGFVGITNIYFCQGIYYYDDLILFIDNGDNGFLSSFYNPHFQKGGGSITFFSNLLLRSL